MIGQQLAQLAPADTNNASLYSPGDGLVGVNITQLIIANNTAGAIAARVFFDHDGTTYDATTALYYDKSIGANDSLVQALDIWMSDTAGNIAVRSATNNALSFTIFGVEYPA